jgi:hypothetical protein
MTKLFVMQSLYTNLPAAKHVPPVLRGAVVLPPCTSSSNGSALPSGASVRPSGGGWLAPVSMTEWRWHGKKKNRVDITGALGYSQKQSI